MIAEHLGARPGPGQEAGPDLPPGSSGRDPALWRSSSPETGQGTPRACGSLTHSRRATSALVLTLGAWSILTHEALPK